MSSLDQLRLEWGIGGTLVERMEIFRIEGRSLEHGEIELALSQRLAERQKLLPKTVAQSVATSREKHVASWIHDLLSHGHRVGREEVVAAGKGRLGVRPIAIWGLPEQVAFRALANRLVKHTGEPSNTRSYVDFVSAPLASSPEYVLSSDIAACYQYVDHGLLVQEIASSTGRRTEVEAMTSLSFLASGRRVGLPQSCYASDVIADAHLAAIDRRLVRQGFEVWRYSDDFRFALQSWPEVVAAIESLDHEVRRLGFALNDAKTVSYLVETYRRRQEGADAALNDLAAEVRMDLTEWDVSYDGETEPIFPEDEEVGREVAERLLRLWFDEVRPRESGGRGDRPENEDSAGRTGATRRLLPRVLPVLDPDDGNLEQALQLLVFEKNLTPKVAAVIRRAAVVDVDSVIAVLSRFLTDHFLTDWQKLWLLDAVLLAEIRPSKDATVLLDWAESLAMSRDVSPYLASNALLFLAIQSPRKAPAETLGRSYDRAGAASKPVVAAAIGAARITGRVSSSVCAESRLNQWSFEFGQSLSRAGS